MAPAPSQLGFREVLRLKPLRRLWTAQLVSVFGDFLAFFAVLSLVSFRLRGTAPQVTGITISFMAPFALVGPVAGVFVDRWNVKRTMIASDLIRAVLALLLIFATNVYGIYAIFFALSAVSSFFVPAQSVAVRTLVPKEGLMSANALMQQAFQVMRIVSPSIAGALVASLGEKSCFYLDSASFVFSAAMLSMVVITREPQPGARDVRSIVTDLVAGNRFILTHSAISFVVLSMTAGMFAISCFSALIAIYVRDNLKSGSMLFGVISSMVGVGMIFGTQFINRFARRRSKSHLVVLGLTAIGLSVGIMAATARAPVALLAALGVGIGVALILIPAQTLMQQETPPSMVGRVSSSFMSLLAVAQMIGLMLSGSMAQLVGIPNVFYASAALLWLIALVGLRSLRSGTATVAGPAVE